VSGRRFARGTEVVLAAVARRRNMVVIASSRSLPMSSPSSAGAR
jgi:hypothetical protein